MEDEVARQEDAEADFIMGLKEEEAEGEQQGKRGGEGDMRKKQGGRLIPIQEGDEGVSVPVVSK